MLPHNSILLTPKGFALLEAMLKQLGPRRDLLSIMLAEKLKRARVITASQVDWDIATLNSRVQYRVDLGPPDERILVWRPEQELYGATLPISAPRGLAMIGMRAGQRAAVPRLDGRIEHLTLEAVLWQPENPSGLDAEEQARADQSQAGGPCLITSLAALKARRARPSDSGDGSDDPGPTAA